MSVLVDDLLLLARLDQGRPLERMPVDMAFLALEAIADARVVEPERSIEWDGDFAEQAMVIGDEQRLRQVVGNLLANVRQHTPVDAGHRVGAPPERPRGAGGGRRWTGPRRGAGRSGVRALLPSRPFAVTRRRGRALVPARVSGCRSSQPSQRPTAATPAGRAPPATVPGSEIDLPAADSD